MSTVPTVDTVGSNAGSGVASITLTMTSAYRAIGENIILIAYAGPAITSITGTKSGSWSLLYNLSGTGANTYVWVGVTTSTSGADVLTITLTSTGIIVASACSIANSPAFDTANAVTFISASQTSVTESTTALTRGAALGLGLVTANAVSGTFGNGGSQSNVRTGTGVAELAAISKYNTPVNGGYSMTWTDTVAVVFAGVVIPALPNQSVISYVEKDSALAAFQSQNTDWFINPTGLFLPRHSTIVSSKLVTFSPSQFQPTIDNAVDNIYYMPIKPVVPPIPPVNNPPKGRSVFRHRWARR